MSTIVKVEYTEALPLRRESSLVEGIYYNANDRTAIFDLNDRIYRYSGVTRTDALTVANASSVGSEYQRFKRKFGPSESLGEYGEIDWQKVPTRLSITSTAGKINAETISVSAVPSRLSLVESNTDKVYNNFKVGFVVVEDTGVQGSISDIKYHNLIATSVPEAVLKVEELARMLDLTFKIKEVTVYFD